MHRFIAVIGFLVAPSCSDAFDKAGDTKPASPIILIQIMIAERISGTDRIYFLSRPQILAAENQTSDLVIGGGASFLGGLHNTGVVYTRDRIDLRVTARRTSDARVQLDVVAKLKGNPGHVVAYGDRQSGRYASFLNAEEGELVVTPSAKVTEWSIKEQKTPWLGDLRVIGWMFRKQVVEASHTEIFVMLIPRIVVNPEDTERISLEQQDMATCYLHHQQISNRDAED